MNKIALAVVATAFTANSGWANDINEGQFLRDVYAEGGKTLYCAEDFTPDSRISVEHIYDERRLAQHFGCRSARLCQNNSEFAEIKRDRHALFAVTRKAELDRRRTLFGDLPATTAETACGYKQSFQVFEPPKHSKGDVARTVLYLHDRYDLPLLGTLDMYQRWHEEDPVDDEERRRNNVIESVQGNRNPFVDDPQKAINMQSKSPLNMQFP